MHKSVLTLRESFTVQLSLEVQPTQCTKRNAKLKQGRCAHQTDLQSHMFRCLKYLPRPSAQLSQDFLPRSHAWPFVFVLHRLWAQTFPQHICSTTQVPRLCPFMPSPFPSYGGLASSGNSDRLKHAAVAVPIGCAGCNRACVVEGASLCPSEHKLAKVGGRLPQ